MIKKKIKKVCFVRGKFVKTYCLILLSKLGIFLFFLYAFLFGINNKNKLFAL